MTSEPMRTGIIEEARELARKAAAADGAEKVELQALVFLKLAEIRLTTANWRHHRIGSVRLILGMSTSEFSACLRLARELAGNQPPEEETSSIMREIIRLAKK